ncbi:MAG: SGNH/GDSL hydrolase family protein [Oscillospiraceae bacterium]|nr:SGNH/GDSL hydrolase family protein [Oscillospiraceae bacterium]
MKKRIRTALACALCFIALFLALSRLLMPKYASFPFEGALSGEYYEDAGGNDVLFFGDCEVFESFSPVVLWRQYGITSCIRGGPEQRLWQSYYLLEDALKYETPKVVVLNVLALKDGEAASEAYNRMNIDGMRLSLTKLRCARASMTEEESLLSYIFPIFRYHSRWQSLTGDDFKYFFGSRQVSHNGYLMRVDTRPLETLPAVKPLADYTFSEKALEYLDMLRELCEERGIRLVLIKAPSAYPHWYDEWDKQASDYAARHGLTYINFLNLGNETGIDMSTDTYDNGLHLNLSGAEKLSAWFGNWLIEETSVSDGRDDAALSAAWSGRAAFYDRMKQDQLAELAEYGYLINYGGRPPEE